MGELVKARTPSNMSYYLQDTPQFKCSPRRPSKVNLSDLACAITLGHNTLISTFFKTLVISDMVVDHLYSTQSAEYYHNIEMILVCGDMPYENLEFLVISMNIPLLYMPGNHDPVYDQKKDAAHAEGCDYLDREISTVKGLYIAGVCGRYVTDQVLPA